MLEVRTYGLGGMSRTKKALLAIALVAAGALFLTIGLVLLLGLAAVGTVGTIAVLAWRRLTGRRLLRPPPLDPHGAVRIVEQGSVRGADGAPAGGGSVRAGGDALLRALPEAERGDTSHETGSER
jgi:hypothetical protein